jgi:hypothetical protein
LIEIALTKVNCPARAIVTAPVCALILLPIAIVRRDALFPAALAGVWIAHRGSRRCRGSGRRGGRWGEYPAPRAPA